MSCCRILVGLGRAWRVCVATSAGTDHPAWAAHLPAGSRLDPLHSVYQSHKSPPATVNYRNGPPSLSSSPSSRQSVGPTTQRLSIPQITTSNCKLKFSHTRYQALRPELIPVYRQSVRRWLEAIHPAVGCHYSLPGLRLPSQPQSVTAHWPVPNYTAWWQRHMRVSSLPKGVTWKRTGRDSNLRPLGWWANVLPLSHTATNYYTSLITHHIINISNHDHNRLTTTTASIWQPFSPVLLFHLFQ